MQVRSATHNATTLSTTSPRQRIHLTAQQARAEHLKELERVDSLRAFDGSALDLDTRDHFTRFEQPGDELSAGIARTGWFRERAIPELAAPTLEYATSSAVHLPGQPARETVVTGCHVPSAGIWYTHRVQDTPEGLQCEELVLHENDLGSSTRDVWLLAK